MKALVVDPGKMTGYGFLEWEQFAPPASLQLIFGEIPKPVGISFIGNELPMNDFLDQAYTWVMNPQPPAHSVDIVICESFDVRADTSQKVAGGPMWSSEQIGVLRFWCRWRGIPFILQTPSDMKSFDDYPKRTKTKKLGWWYDKNPAEKGHRRDAASHAVLYAMRHNLIDPRCFL